MNKRVVLAIGGNSLIKDPNHITVSNQYNAAVETSKHISCLTKHCNNLVITHGNGPQVGFILRRSELSKNHLHEVPLDSCVADSQGAIGYNLQMALRNEFVKKNIKKTIVSLITQVLVDKNDPSFKNPTKPIGSFMDEKTAQEKVKLEGWKVIEDSGRGYRRVVPSPKPKEIIELEAIKYLMNEDNVIIALGGGGIPVRLTKKGEIEGIEAVIDKDFASSLLAKEIMADLLIISTSVKHVFLNYGTKKQKPLSSLTVAEAEMYLKQGHFAEGSMKPKVEAILDFVKKTGKKGIITSPDNIEMAIIGKSGTQITN